MESENNSGLTRRDWLKGVAAVGASAALSGCAGIGENARNQSRSTGSADLVRRENQRPVCHEGRDPRKSRHERDDDARQRDCDGEQDLETSRIH